MNVHAVAKMPATERKEVSQVKGKDAIKRSTIAKAAPTLPKSMPVSFIWVLPASPDKDRAPPSSRMFPLQHSPNAVSTRRAGIQVTHRKVEAHPRVPDPPGSPQAARAVLVPTPSICTVVRAPRKSPDKKGEISTEKQARVIKCSPSPNAAIMLRKPMPIYAIRALPASMSSQAIPTQNTPDLVKTCQGVSKMAHQAIEIQARASLASLLDFLLPSSPLHFRRPSPPLPSRSLPSSASTIRKHCLACRAWLQAKSGRLCGVNRPPRPNPLPSCQQSSSFPPSSPFFPLPRLPAQRRQRRLLSAQRMAALPQPATGTSPIAPIGTLTTRYTATPLVAATMPRRIC